MWKLYEQSRLIPTVGALLVVYLGMSPTPSAAGDSFAGPASFPPAAEAAVRIARSDDGLHFTPGDVVLMKHASAPDLLLVDDGTLLALVDQATDPAHPHETAMALSASKDQGRRWSRLQPISFEGPRGEQIRGQHGDLVRLPNGDLRLYFLATPRVEEPRAGKRHRAFIASASARDTSRFRIDPRTHIQPGTLRDAHPTSTWFDGLLHLFTSTLSERDIKSPDASASGHFISRDGRSFVVAPLDRLASAGFIGSVVPVKEGLRAYVTTKQGVRSFVSRDGQKWQREPGVCIADAWDPAVARLPDGSYIMLYCVKLDRDTLTSPQIVDASVLAAAWSDIEGDGVSNQGDARSVEGGDQSGAGLEDASAESALAGGSETTSGNAPIGEPEPADIAGEKPVGTSDGPTGTTGVGDGSSDAMTFEQAFATLPYYQGNWLDHWNPETSGGFAPKPDFKTKVRYGQWYEQYLLGHPQDNAFDVYAQFIPDPYDETNIASEWPELTDMFNSQPGLDRPQPWRASDHPQWAASSETARSLFDQFREATRHDGYASPVDFNAETLEGDPESAELLVGIRLPQLSKHWALGKALLADAWRENEDGCVSPDSMLDTWETIHRGADHLDQGVTLIEELVAMAERKLVSDTARWALKEGVFKTEEELEAALDTLVRFDESKRDPTVSIRGEHALSLDITQYMFSPPTPDGQPKINRDRAKALMGLAEGEATVDDFAKMTPEDVYTTIDAFDEHYHNLAELMSTGYPEVRASDIDSATAEYVHTSPVTESMMPALSRYYKLGARGEASRRATQLSYATHLYKARHGRWPESLDELPGDAGTQMKIDPFSGGYFGYHLTEDGPTIYSASENGIDDGGVHSRRWDDSAAPGESDDHVFWPPQPR